MSDEKSQHIAADDDLDFDLAAIADDPSAGDEPLSEEALDFALSELDEIDELPGDMADEFVAPEVVEPLASDTNEADAVPLDGLDEDQWIPTVDESAPTAVPSESLDIDDDPTQVQPVATSTNFDSSDTNPPAGGKAPLWIAITALLVSIGATATSMLQPRPEPTPAATLDTTEIDAMRDEIGELRPRVIAMQQEIAATPSPISEIAQLREQVASLKTSSSSSPDPALTQKIEAQADEIASLTKAIDLLNQRKATAAIRTGTWSLHLSSFNQRSNAEVIAKKLRAADYPVQIAQTRVSGASWYRISVHNFATRGEADAMRKKLATQFGLANSWIEAPTK
jgi:cell division septation protein DedD